MSNLSIENLSKVIETGDESRFFHSGSLTPLKHSNATSTETRTFSEALRKSIDQVNHFQIQADHAISELAAGRNKNIHETLLAVERADASLKLMMQVRNKVLEAYREIMRMQI